ncbi:MAG: cation transporter [Methanosphaera stadtmanae]|jgi:cation diffusion facilitator family transporter|nr:cation transporter [Methanosphaera stadtmanae]
MENYYDEVRGTLIIILVLNLIIAGVKISYGYYSGILSITSDGYDSALDAIANLVAIIAVILAKKPKDKEHPYGHAKIETFASILIGLSLILVSYEILISAYEKFIHPTNIEINLISFIIMISTLIVNIILSQYEKRKGKQLNSDLLLADSKHTQSDILATSIVIIGLILMHLGLGIADPIISIIIACLIIKTGFSILKENLNILVDANILPTERIDDQICDIEGVENVHNIRTRGTTSNVFVDMHVVVDSNLSMKKAHEISEIIEKKLKNNFTQINEVLIHLESEEGMSDLEELD